MKPVQAFGYWLRRIIGQPDAPAISPEPLEHCGWADTTDHRLDALGYMLGGWAQDPTLQAQLSPWGRKMLDDAKGSYQGRRLPNVPLFAFDPASPYPDRAGAARFRLRGVSFAHPGEPPVFYRFNHEEKTMTEEVDTPEPIITGSNRDDRMTALQLAIGYSTGSYLEETALIALAERMERYLTTGAVAENAPDPEAEKIDQAKAFAAAARDRVYPLHYIPPPGGERPMPTHEYPRLGPELAPPFTDPAGWTRVPGFSIVPHPVYLRAFELALEAAVFKGEGSSLAHIQPRASLEQLLTDAKTIGHFLKTGETSIPPATAQRVRTDVHGQSDTDRQAFDQMERLRDQLSASETAGRASVRGSVSADRRGLSGTSLTRDTAQAEPRDEFATAIDSISKAIGLAAEIGDAISEAVSKRNPYR